MNALARRRVGEAHVRFYRRAVDLLAVERGAIEQRAGVALELLPHRDEMIERHLVARVPGCARGRSRQVGATR